MFNIKLATQILLLIMCFSVLSPLQVSHAAPLDDVLSTLTSSAISSSDETGSGGIFDKLFGFVFDKLLSPILSIVSGGKSSTDTNSPVKVTPLPTLNTGSVQDKDSLRGKVIVVDPGHGGSNPGAVANNSRESDNNLAVSLKLRDKLVQAGAKVVMTRDSDRTVAPEGSSLDRELQARVDMAEANHADIFVSIHSNENSNSSIAGAMTFYSSSQSSQLARQVQNAVVEETGAVDKGVDTATYYVLRNTSMPSILVEMGFISNPQEAAKLQNDSYRNRMAQGVFNGIVTYFNNQ